MNILKMLLDWTFKLQCFNLFGCPILELPLLPGLGEAPRHRAKLRREPATYITGAQSEGSPFLFFSLLCFSVCWAHPRREMVLIEGLEVEPIGPIGAPNLYHLFVRETYAARQLSSWRTSNSKVLPGAALL